MQRYALKLVLVGDSRVGKSQLSRAFVNKSFLDDAQVTVGIEFSTKVIEFEKSLIQTHIWDTAGQERMQSMTKAFFRNTAGAILVYDVCNKKSFENLQSVWLKQLRDQGYSDVRLILVGNKVDLVSSSRPREVSIEEATEFARRENMDFMETSALTNYCVEDMFRRISLSVARVLPEVAVHLEVSYLPDGWMACPVDESDESDSTSAISVSDVSAALMNNIPIDSSSPNSVTGQKGNLGAALAQKTRSPLAAEVEELSRREKYVNYWTGECVFERPTVVAGLSPGLLYRAQDTPVVELDPLTGKPLERTAILKERTSSCKTTATFVSNSTNGRDSCLEPNFDLHESRRSRSQGSSLTSDGSGKGGVALSRCFRCVCAIS